MESRAPAPLKTCVHDEFRNSMRLSLANDTLSVSREKSLFQRHDISHNIDQLHQLGREGPRHKSTTSLNGPAPCSQMSFC
jgi:hypothetical protein